MKKKSGFTLIELMITISIIGILTLIIAVSFSSVQKDSRDQRRIADLKAIQNAAEQYYLLKGSYPVNKTTPWSVNSQTILQTFPKDPKGNAYTYFVGNGGYCACSVNMESGKYGNADQANQFPCDFQTSGVNYCVGAQQ